MINLQKQNELLSNAGRYLLAVLFFFESLNCFIHPWSHGDIVVVGGTAYFYLMILLGSVWFIAMLSFLLNVWIRSSGMIIATVILLLISIKEAPALSSSGMYVSSLLSIAFYLAMAGGVLIVVAKKIANNYWGTATGISQGMIIGGRILVGAFFVIVGILHFTHVKGDAQLISGMPGATFWVVFVGVCWIATALSYWTNILTHLSATLSTVLVLIITFTINIQSFGYGNDLGTIMAIANNIGLIGASMMVASTGTYCSMMVCDKRI